MSKLDCEISFGVQRRGNRAACGVHEINGIINLGDPIDLSHYFSKTNLKNKKGDFVGRGNMSDEYSPNIATFEIDESTDLFECEED